MKGTLTSILALLGFLLFGQQEFDFVPNGGQWHPNALYKADVPSGALFLEKDGLKYSFYDASFFHNLHEGHQIGDHLSFHAFKLQFENANEPKLQLIGIKEGEINYFLGNDPEKWAKGLRAGGEVYYTGLYDHIDFRIYSRGGSLKYDFIVHPGGRVEDIKIRFKGLDQLFLKEGELQMVTSLGTLVDAKPVSIQRGVDDIATRYKVEGDLVSFWVDSYDVNQTLIIDPVLIFSTYSGSVANNFGYTATYDNKGYLYAGGSVFSQGYPTTNGAFDVTFNSYANTAGWANFSGWYWGVSDIGITKYNLNGTSRIYSTYIGGAHCEVPHSLVVNNRDELFILGTTSSSNYPTTPTAFDTSFAGGTQLNLARGIFVNYTEGSDLIVSRLSKNGDAMLASTFVGGSLNDGLNMNVDLVANYADQMRGEIILDKNENVIIGSSTASLDFPITLNAYQNTYGGGDQDGVVFKMNEDLSAMLWSSYYGGTEADGVYSVIASNDDNIYFAGGTKSSNLIFPSDAYQTSYQGGLTDGYYVKLKDDGTSLLKGSYFGSDQYDQIYFVREDASSQVYFFGQSDKFGSYWIQNALYNSPNSGQFLSKLNPTQQGLDWSTTFGSGDNKINISPTAFMVDLCNKVYLSGWGSPDSGFDQIGGSVANGTSGMEVTSGAYKATTDNHDFYLMVLEDDASSLFYASFFGGDQSHEHVDGGTSRFDSKGVMYQSACAGCGGNDDFPIFPPNVVGPTNDGVFYNLNGDGYPVGCNNGVFKFDFGIPNIIADFNNPPVICSPGTIDFEDNSKVQSATTWQWDFGDGTMSTDTNPSHTYASSGVYTVKLVIRDPTACNLIDSISKEVTIMGGLVYQQGTDTVCLNSNTQLGLIPYADTAVTYSWTPAVGLSNTQISNPIATVDHSRTYQLVIQNNTCADTLYQSVYPLSLPYEFGDTVSCVQENHEIVFQGGGAYENYQYSSTSLFTDTLNSSLLDSVFTILTPSHNTTYHVRATDENGCVIQDSMRLQVVGVKSNLSPVEFCLNDTIEILDTLNGEFVNGYNWTPTDSIISQLNGVALVSPFDTMTYALIKDYGLSCFDTVLVTINVHADQPIPLKDTLLCNENKDITLWVDTSFAANQNLWSGVSDFSDTLSIAEKLRFTPIIGDTTLHLSYIDGFGCEHLDSITITNIEFIIQTTADSVFCGTSLINAEVVNYTIDRFDSLVWLPSSKVIGDSSQLQIGLNPDEDVNLVWVEGVDTNGCRDQDTVIVLNLSIAGSDLPDTSVCYGDSVVIGVDFDNTNFVNFSWFPDTLLSNANIPNPTVLATDTIIYGLIIDNGACVDTFYQTINVSQVEVTAYKDTVLCNSEAVISLSDSSRSNLTHHWSSNDGFTDTLLVGINQNEFNVLPVIGTSNYYVLVEDEIGCKAIDSIQIDKYLFDLEFDKEYSLCLHDTIEIIPDGYLDYDSVRFNWGPASILVSNVNDTVGKVSPVSGIYEIVVNSKSAYGCFDTDTIQVEVAKYDTSVVQLTTSYDTLIKGEVSVLTALPEGMVYTWIPNEGIISVDSNTAVVSVDKSTTYTVVVSDSILNQCSRTDSVSIIYIDAICGSPYIYVPNAFTPNGDGENDVMYVRGRNITELYFAIYNRWGQKVFETEDQSVGWDGTYNSMLVDPAVFDYYLKFKCDDQKEHFMKGNITLIR